MTLWSFPWSWEPVILSEEIDSEKSSQPIPSLLCQPQQGGEPVLRTWCEMTIICFENDLKMQFFFKQSRGADNCLQEVFSNGFSFCERQPPGDQAGPPH